MGETEQRSSESEAMLAALIDRLPPFSAHWSAERIDLWFRWWFELLEEVLRPIAPSSDQSGTGR